MSTPHGTFSIVAIDPEAGEAGCAVQSKYFSVGSVVPWARAGVGAAATQAAGVAVYGRLALDALGGGSSPQEAIDRVLADDDGRETRQLGVVAADGRAAAFTGAKCLDWAGHRVGDGYAVQGNILAVEAVVADMARAFEETGGPLVERLVAALEAGQRAGGDRRGQQSAAVVVERLHAGGESREGIDRVCDLRVEDHPEPIAELRRLVGIWTLWDAQRRAHAAYERGDPEGAADVMAEAVAAAAEPDAGGLYNLACYESRAGRRDAAIAHLRSSLELDPSFRELIAGDSDLDPIRDAVAAL